MGGFQKNSTSTGGTSGSSTTTLSPEVQNAYSQLLSQFGGLSNTSAANPTVSSATTGLGSLAANSNNPALTAAGTTLGTAAQPASASIGDYLSPYLSGALQTQIASQNQQNGQQQQQLLGDAVSKGALGGNRIGVAQGQLAGQQALANNAANSGLINSAYQSAENSALAGQQNLTAAGNAQAGLGSTQNQTSLSDLLGLLGAGQYQQTAPYTNLGTLASTANALSNNGATISSTGTSSSTQPSGNTLSSLLGLGLGIAGLFRDGGRVGYATGGSTGFGDMASALDAALSGSANLAKQDPANQNSGQSGQLSASEKTGLGNIKNWLMPQQAQVGREVSGLATYAHGGGVRGYDSGGYVDNPYASFGDADGMFSDAGLGVTPQLGNVPPLRPQPVPKPIDVSGSNVIPLALRMSRLGDMAAGSAITAQPENDSRPMPAGAIMPAGGLGALFATDEQAYGLPQGYLAKTAGIESNDNPQADNGIAHGLFQFTDPTARQYGLGNPYDPVASTEKAAQLAADNSRVLAQGLGRAPTAGELYLAHQQGASGALGLLSNPDAPATSIVGRDAVMQNGGTPDMTAGQFAQHWIGRFDTGGQLADVNAVAPSLGTMPPDYRGASFQQPGNFSQNIGDVFNSLKAGKGLNLSPDARFALSQAGFGMMAGTSPNALTNIGTGGQAGLSAYADRLKLARENAQAESGIAAQQGALQLQGVSAAQSARELELLAARTGSDINAQTAGAGLTGVQSNAARFVRTPTAAGMIVYDVMNPQAQPRLIPWNQMASSASSGNASGAGPDAPAGTSPASGSGGFWSTPAPAPDSAAGQSTRPMPGPFTDRAPDNIPIDGRLMSPVPAVADQAVSEGTDAIKGARTNALAAQNAQVQLQEMQHDFATADQGGWMTQQGSAFPERVKFAKAVNTAMTGMGIAPLYDTQAVGAGEDLNKQTTRLGFELSRTLGSREAASIVTESVAAVPGGSNSPEGAKRIIQGLQAANQRSIDYYNFVQDWTSKSGGSVRGADAAFNKSNPPELYAIASYVPSPAIAYLRQHPDAAKDFDAKYGNGQDISRFIVGAQ